MTISTRRIYGDERRGDEFRVLVDRLWSRGIKKTDADIDLWLKDLSPSSELRRWFHDDPDSRYEAFAERFKEELEERDLDLAEIEEHTAIVLLTGVKDMERSHIPTMIDYLKQRLSEEK